MTLVKYPVGIFLIINLYATILSILLSLECTDKAQLTWSPERMNISVPFETQKPFSQGKICYILNPIVWGCSPCLVMLFIVSIIPGEYCVCIDVLKVTCQAGYKYCMVLLVLYVIRCCSTEMEMGQPCTSFVCSRCDLI